MSTTAALPYDNDDPWYHALFGETLPAGGLAPAPPAGGAAAVLDAAMLHVVDELFDNATRGVYKSRRQKRAGDDATAPPPAQNWASKRPAGSAVRQVEAGDATCPGSKPGELPGCYFPYSLPDSDTAGERIRWNAVKFNPRNGEEDKVFRELDAVDRVVLHLARARSRLAAALGIWRKTDRQPFKTVTPYQMKLFMDSVINEMAYNSGVPQLFDPVGSGTVQRAAHTMREAGLEKSTSDHEYLALPRVASWGERFEELTDENAIEEWTRFMSDDAEDALATGYKWIKRINGRPDIGLFSWRNGEKIAREGAGDAKFRTQYSQSWNYLDLALRHIYEAVRLMALRSAQLAKAGADATDERVRRLAILPGDARLLLVAAHLFPTYLGTPVDVDVPSHLLKFSPVDAISRAIELNLREGEDYRTLKVTRITDEDGKEVLVSRPVFAIYAIAAHLMATSSGKQRTRERERLWKANGGRGVVAYAQTVEVMLKAKAFGDPAYSAGAYSVDLESYFDADNATANAVPEALTKLPTIAPHTRQYDDPSDKQVEEQPTIEEEEQPINNIVIQEEEQPAIEEEEEEEQPIPQEERPAIEEEPFQMPEGNPMTHWTFSPDLLAGVEEYLAANREEEDQPSQGEDAEWL